MPTKADIDKGPLCVGGPIAGRRVVMRDGAEVMIATERRYLPRNAVAADAPVMAKPPKQTTYRIQRFGTPDATFVVWAPEGQDEGQTMIELLIAYEGAHRR